MKESPEMKNEKQTINKEEAILQVEHIRQMVYIMGANDYEIPALNDILRALEDGEIESIRAVEQAEKIRDSKQDYH